MSNSENLINENENIPQVCIQLIHEIGYDNTIKVLKLFDGEQVYIPRYDSISRKLRNKQIIKEFNGFNYKELSKKYRLTHIMIRNIVKNT